MTLRSLVAAGLFLVLPLAHAQHMHVHGEGRLDVVIDGGKVNLKLELPLDAAVGFERAPKTAREKAALTETERLLKDATALFVPTAAANCTLGKVEVDLPDFTGGEHADIEAEYDFTCGAPAALKGIETTAFKSFKRLYRLEVQRSGPAGQGAARLTPKKPILTW